MNVRVEPQGELGIVLVLGDGGVRIEVLRAKTWRARLRFLVRIPGERSLLQRLFGAETADTYGTAAAMSLQSFVPEPFSWAQATLALLVDGAEAPPAGSESSTVQHLVSEIDKLARAAGIHPTAHDDDNVLAPHIVDALTRLPHSESEHPGLDWYLFHYRKRAELFERKSTALFDVGSSTYEDDWVYRVSIEMLRMGASATGDLVVLVCADPEEYRRLTDETTLTWLGAVSGDVLHFIWMTDRHGKPALSVKRAIVADLRDAGITVPDDGPLLIFVTLRREGDYVSADVQGVVPVLGRLDSEATKAMFTSIVAYTKNNTPMVDVDRFVSGLRKELAALYVIKSFPMIDWFREVVKKLFDKKLGNG